MAAGLMLVIFLGESAVANAELPRTKGHGMSYGWVSAGGTGCSRDSMQTPCCSSHTARACLESAETHCCMCMPSEDSCDLQ